MNDIVKHEANSLADYQDPTTNVMSAIVQAAANPAVDPDKMERMMAMYERMEAKKAESEFNLAMNACQMEMRRVQADAQNPQTRSKYATYAALDKALRPIYTDKGLSLSFDTSDAAEGFVRVLCYVAHQSGHSRTYRVDMPADGLGIKGTQMMTRTHAAGSAMSYGMRYLLKMIFNVAVGEDDDDGNGANKQKQPQKSKISNERLKSAIEAIKKDEYTIEQLLERFQLTLEQVQFMENEGFKVKGE